MTTTIPLQSDIFLYSLSIPPIYTAIMLGFRQSSPERKYCEAVLESSLRNYVKFPTRQTLLPLPISLTDIELTEAIRQLIAQEFVVRRQLTQQGSAVLTSNSFSSTSGSSLDFQYGQHYLLAPTPIGEMLIEGITGTRTPDPVVPQLPIPSWAAPK